MCERERERERGVCVSERERHRENRERQRESLPTRESVKSPIMNAHCITLRVAFQDSGLEFGVWNFGLRVSDFGFGLLGLGGMVEGLSSGCGVEGSGSRVCGLELKVRVEG